MLEAHWKCAGITLKIYVGNMKEKCWECTENVLLEIHSKYIEIMVEVHWKYAGNKIVLEIQYVALKTI